VREEGGQALCKIATPEAMAILMSAIEDHDRLGAWLGDAMCRTS
jgi:hypothetical protein